MVLAGGRVVAHTEEHRAHREDEQVSRQGSSSSAGSSIVPARLGGVDAPSVSCAV